MGNFWARSHAQQVMAQRIRSSTGAEHVSVHIGSFLKSAFTPCMLSSMASGYSWNEASRLATVSTSVRSLGPL